MALRAGTGSLQVGNVRYYLVVQGQQGTLMPVYIEKKVDIW